MISANEAKEMVSQYNINKEEECKQTAAHKAAHKLEIISNYIKSNALNGLLFLRINDKVSFFREQRVEDIAAEELKKLGYNVDTSNGHFIVRW